MERLGAAVVAGALAVAAVVVGRLSGLSLPLLALLLTAAALLPLLAYLNTLAARRRRRRIVPATPLPAAGLARPRVTALAPRAATGTAGHVMRGSGLSGASASGGLALASTDGSSTSSRASAVSSRLRRWALGQCGRKEEGRRAKGESVFALARRNGRFFFYPCPFLFFLQPRAGSGRDWCAAEYDIERL